MDPGTFAGAAFSGLNALITIIKHSAHYREVPEEVTHLQVNIRLADKAIKTARRLQRLDGMCIGDALTADVDESIENVERILDLVRETVEGCRRDLQLRGTVGPSNRAKWMLWGQEQFASKLATLTNTLAALNRDITRMELAVRSLPTAPYYPSIKLQEDGLEPVKFPRSPTVRRTMRKKTASSTNLSISSNNSQVTLVAGDQQEDTEDEQNTGSRSGLGLLISDQMIGQSAQTAGDPNLLSPYSGTYYHSPGGDSPLRLVESAPEGLDLSYTHPTREQDSCERMVPKCAPPSPAVVSARGVSVRRRSNFI